MRPFLTALSALTLACVPPALAQGRVPIDTAEFSRYNTPYDGRFTFVRLRFTPSVMSGFGGGGGAFGGLDLKWDHDYPRADRHFSRILAELTALRSRPDGGNILGAEDPELFRFPVAYVSEPGFWAVTESEAANLRGYLLKGGFLILDDFAGPSQFAGAERALRKILPALQLVQLEASHPVFHAFFDIDSLNFAHPYFEVPASFYGVFEDNDPRKRLMVVLNYNNDIGESWEFSDLGWIPIDLTNTAYKLGINYVMYALTH